MLNVVISGVVVGALYAIAGLALVAAYRTTRVLNFALGGMGAVATYAAYSMLEHALPYGVVLVLALLIGGVLGLVVEVAVARPLRRRPPITIALGTLGALLILQGAVGAKYGYGTYSLRPLLANVPGVHIGSFGLSFNRVLILVLTVVATGALALLVMKTRFGLAMRATSSGPLTADLMGVNVSVTRLISWGIGGVLGALAAMLVTPATYLSPSSFTTFLLTAFAAVVLGGFTSLSGVVIGAVVFGVAINLANTYLPAGLTASYTFVGVALVLLLRPHGIFGRAENQVVEPTLSRSAAESAISVGSKTAAYSARRSSWGSALTRHGGWLVVLAVMLLLPVLLASVDLYLATTLVATFIAVVGLNVVTGYSGQVSLAHAGFLAVGAYSAAILQQHSSASPYVALVFATLVGALAGLIIGLPATRLSGIYLVVLTLVFTFAIPELVTRIGDLTGGAEGLPLPLPAALMEPIASYWFTLALGAAVALVISWVASTRVGRSWRAVRDSETGARALGMNPTLVRLGAFTLSAALAGLSGALLGMLSGFVGPQSFDVFMSIYLLLAVVLGGSGSIFGSLLGAAFITLVPHYLPTQLPPDIVYGVVLILVLIGAPNGLAGLLRSGLASVAAVRPSPGAEDADESVPQVDTDDASPSIADEGRVETSSTVPLLVPVASPEQTLLGLRGVCSGYGLTTVLHDINLHVAEGEVVALLGANGVGKSTLLRTISQAIRHTAGTISWDGRDIGGTGLASPHAITRAGISHVPEGRAIFPDLSVAENLTMGTFGLGPRAPADGSGTDRDAVFEYFPRLRDRLSQRAGTLSGGEQQMLAIGRALLARPRLLAVDEPSLGLAPVITQQVFEIIRAIANSGVAVLIVEQNVDAALDLADRGYVMSGGRVVMGGAAAELRDDDRVAETYLANGSR